MTTEDLYRIILFILTLPKTIKGFANAIKGCSEIRQIHQCPALGIRIINLQYDKKERNKLIMLIVIFAGCIFLFSYWFFEENNSFLSSAALFCLILEGILYIVWCVLQLICGQEAYLTYEGVVTAARCFRPDQCEFTINTEKYGNMEIKYIFVYLKKGSLPYQFQITEREEECLKWVQSW